MMIIIYWQDNVRSLFESQRLTDGAFRIVSAVTIDEMRSVFYAGRMESLFGRFGAKVASMGYMRSSHNVRTEGTMRNEVRICVIL